MTSEERVPSGLDSTVPNIARVYDYMLGGKDNFEADRKVAEATIELMPDAPFAGRNNRGFLRRAVTHMAAQGIRQFLDLGSGLPTQGNVHEIAQSVDPAARVVYVDLDEVVRVHSLALLTGGDVRVVTGDVREPGKVMADPAVAEAIDFDQPVGLLMLAILHHINDDEDPVGISAAYRDALAPGSHVAISHFFNAGSERPEEAARAVASEELFTSSFGTGRWRTHDEIRAYFGDWEMLDPGIVPLKEWRPDPGDDPTPDLTHYQFVGGVARKR